MTELLRLTMTGADDLASLRHVASRAAQLLGFETADATRVATSASELGRFTQAHLPVDVQFLVTEHDAPALEIAFRSGSGRIDLDTTTGVTVQRALARLMDEIEIAPSVITIRKLLTRPVGAPRLAEVRDALIVERPKDLRAVLQTQNDELVEALVLLREREGELVRLNAELDQTNRGVVALYAELEARATEVRQAQRVVFEELEGALRPPPPVVPSLELDVRYLPAQANSPTGGDLYDWFVLPDGTVHVTVVDVQGHGVMSTRDALQVTHAVRTLSLEGHLLGQVLGRVDALSRSLGAGVIATALVARFDVTTGLVRIAGAGHPEVLVIPHDGSPEFVRAPGRPVGYAGAGSRQVSTIHLSPGDTALLYTDGLIEVRHDVIEGMETLRQAAAMTNRMPVAQQLDTILAACTHGDDLQDDTLLLAARWMPAEG